MISVVKYEPKHMEELVKLDIPKLIKSLMGPKNMQLLSLQKYTYTILSESGRVLFCGGIREYWPERGEVWAIINPDCKKEFLSIHHAVKRFLSICPFNRIEATVDVDFKEGHRWVKSLGFKLEADRLKSFYPDGTDCSMYSIVRL